MRCTLCAQGNNPVFYSDKHRQYLRCQRCALVYVDKYFWLSAEQEKAVYDLHQNNCDDVAYRGFLSRLVEPLKKEVAINTQGLDFGCGPGPTLSVMMQESGRAMQLYDIFYQPNKTVLEQSYDFITATEVLEHLFNPAEVFAQLWAMLKPNGLLAIMTKLVIDAQAFATWHYKNDRTHVCFYSKETFDYLTRQYSADVKFIDSDVIFLRKLAPHAMV